MAGCRWVNGRGRYAIPLVLGVLSPVGLSAEETLRSDSVGLWESAQEVAGESWRLLALNSIGEPVPTDIQLGPQEDLSESFVEVWERLLPHLEETLALSEEQSQLPDSAWIGRDKGDVRSEVDTLLDEAIGLLGISDATEFRQQIQALERAIEAHRQQIAEYRRKRVVAPRESTWQTTASDYEEKIAALQDEISAYEGEIDTIRQRFAAHLRGIGLDLDNEQLEFLLSTVVGEDVVQMGIAFDNVKKMTLQLEKLVEASREELDTARRYYGMYTVLLRVLEQMYDHLVTRIAQEYLPNIDAIIRRTHRLADETEALLKQYPERAEVLRANRDSQRLTLKASRLYRRYLEEQQADVEAALARLGEDIRIAANTYDTVKISGELIAIVRNSHHLLETLGRMQVPALRGFENLEMKREFQRLTRQMRKDPVAE